MQITQLQRPLRAAASAAYRSALSLSWATTHPQRRRTAEDANAAVEGRRWATVKSQGAYKLTSKKTIPKKMGAKRSGGMSAELLTLPSWPAVWLQRGPCPRTEMLTCLSPNRAIRHPRKHHIQAARNNLARRREHHPRPRSHHPRRHKRIRQVLPRPGPPPAPPVHRCCLQPRG